MSQRYIGGVVTETTDVAKAPWTGSWTQQAALQGFAGAQAPLRIANSLRFRSSASAYLSRAPASAGTRTKVTISLWVKRGLLGARTPLIVVRQGTTDYFLLEFQADDTLQAINVVGSSVNTQLVTTQVFRDPSAWYNIVFTYDSTVSSPSASNIYLSANGNQITALSTATYPSQNTNLYYNVGSVEHDIAKLGNLSTYGDCYFAEVNSIDGQALPPTAFGQFNKTSGVWQAMPYTGTYGTNGFRLNFSNGTSTTTLGYDSSGNSNNWTTNNISLTAGSTYDWMIDSPTKYPGSSYGVGNYCVGNPLSVGANTSLSNANLSGTLTGAGGWAGSIGGLTSGKWYWEATLTANSGNSVWVGFLSDAYKLNDNAWSFSTQVALYANDGRNGNNVAYGATWTTNDVIGIALDLDAGSITFYKNNTSQGVMFSSLTASALWRPFVSGGGTGTTIAMNFGQRPFAYTPPSGYKSLCTQNLPVATIYNGAQYMAATTYTGTGSSLSVSNAVNSISFQPDFVWIKSRSAATDHALYDVIRGVQARLESNTTDAEVTSDNGLTAFGSSGFTVNTLAQVNTNAATYVGWQWKAGGTAVTNNAGTVTAQVSANATAGFSVVTANYFSGTMGHGLGVAPSMIIAKQRSAVNGWYVYHVNSNAGSGANNTSLFLQNTDASTNIGTNLWNVTSTTFGSNQSLSGTGVYYCFAAIAGYSAFGSYTGNGSADGPFVYCGFRPRYILIKGATNAGSYWVVRDSARSTYNVVDLDLYPNASDAENQNSANYTDFLSNGFKLRNTGSGSNTSGATYIYAVFAENPFQISLAR